MNTGNTFNCVMINSLIAQWSDLGYHCIPLPNAGITISIVNGLHSPTGFVKQKGDFIKYSNTSFDFFPSAYGDTYNDNRTNQSSFESRGLVSQGYQEPNYSISGAGYTATNFFGNNTPQPTFTGIATSAQKATLSSLTGGLLG